MMLMVVKEKNDFLVLMFFINIEGINSTNMYCHALVLYMVINAPAMSWQFFHQEAEGVEKMITGPHLGQFFIKASWLSQQTTCLLKTVLFNRNHYWACSHPQTEGLVINTYST